METTHAKPLSSAGPRTATPPLTVEISASAGQLRSVSDAAPETERQVSVSAVPSAATAPEVEESASVPACTPVSAVSPETLPAVTFSVPSRFSPRISPEVELSVRRPARSAAASMSPETVSSEISRAATPDAETSPEDVRMETAERSSASACGTCTSSRLASSSDMPACSHAPFQRIESVPPSISSASFSSSSSARRAVSVTVTTSPSYSESVTGPPGQSITSSSR